MEERKIKTFREEKGLTQQEMAKKIGVSFSFYSKVESGYRNPSFAFLKKLKKRFPDVDIDEMFF